MMHPNWIKLGRSYVWAPHIMAVTEDEKHPEASYVAMSDGASLYVPLAAEVVVLLADEARERSKQQSFATKIDSIERQFGAL